MRNNSPAIGKTLNLALVLRADEVLRWRSG
jgi:hypothetical protein